MGTRSANVTTLTTSSWRTSWPKMARLTTADTLSMITNMLYILRALSPQIGRGCFLCHGVLIPLASRKKMVYSASFDSLKKAFTGVQKIIQANGADEVEQSCIEDLLQQAARK